MRFRGPLLSYPWPQRSTTTRDDRTGERRGINAGELGIRVNNGKVAFEPIVETVRITKDASFRYLDVNNQWQTIELAAGSLAFTWCQVPIIYILNREMSLTLKTSTGHHGSQRLTLDAETASNLFGRTGHVNKLPCI